VLTKTLFNNKNIFSCLLCVFVFEKLFIASVLILAKKTGFVNLFAEKIRKFVN